MEQEFPFRPRGKHGFDREDVIHYISQIQVRCNEYIARTEELEAAKDAWVAQAKNLEREVTALQSRNRELEEQLENARSSDEGAPGAWYRTGPFAARPQDEAEGVASQQHLQELEAKVREQLLAAQELAKELEDERTLTQTLRDEKAALEREFAEQAVQAAEVLPRFNMHEHELDTLRTQLEQQASSSQQFVARVNAAEQEAEQLKGIVSALQNEKTLLQSEKNALQAERDHLLGECNAAREKLGSLQTEKSVYDEKMPALQEQLTQLAQAAEQISALEAAKAVLQEELEVVRAQMRYASEDAMAKQTRIEDLQRENEALLQQKEDLEQRIARLNQELAAEQQEQLDLEARIDELEHAPHNNPEDGLRSMILSSFNYANLYVDNNLKTAQFISDATSRNITRVSDSANTLLEQLDGISRSFGDTTDGIRRDLAAFQTELTTIQSGLNRRLSQERFKTLVDENERLRERLESELLAELSGETDSDLFDDAVQEPTPEAPALPFANELPNDYRAFLDD